MQMAWQESSLQFAEQQIRSACVLLALIEYRKHRINQDDGLQWLDQIDAAHLRVHFAEILLSSVEQVKVANNSSSSGQPMASSSEQALARFTINLTEKARAGDIDPV